MAKEPKTVFLLSVDDFAEISYEEFTEKYKADRAYMESHFFVRLGDYLMEVSKEDYEEHYRQRRRQKYLDELAAANGDVSYDALTTAEWHGEDTLLDPSGNIADEVTRKLLLEKLDQVLPLLTQDEQLLIHQHYFLDISEVKLSGMYAVTQQAISKRIAKIRQKLKKLLEN